MINEIRKDQTDRKAQILSAFKNVENDPKVATIISKADFEAQYPETEFERYSLKSLTKFREELNKSEDVVDKDGAFKDAVKDFRHFMVVHNGAKAPMFVRKLDNLEKGAGEGSRGGKVIGHTSAGTPIYEHHKDFKGKYYNDHRDARSLHEKMAKNAKDVKTKKHHEEQAKLHGAQAGGANPPKGLGWHGD